MGIPFVVYTDHVALTYWLKKKPVNEQHARWLAKIQDLVFDIRYVAGDDNIFADLMSRPEGVGKSTHEELLEEGCKINGSYAENSTSHQEMHSLSGALDTFGI